MSILQATAIKKSFGGVTALRNGCLTCHAGCITGLLGANGSGKSTISKIITGLYQYDEGNITYNGKTVRFKSPGEARKNGIAMVYQNLSLIGDLTVWENIELGQEVNRGMFTDDKIAKARARIWIEKLCPGLDINKKVSNLHPGEMQILEIAKAISTNPKVLILDEPTAALEQTEVYSLFKVMRELAQNGVAMIFISHRLWEVMEICDDVVVFRNGENVGHIDFRTEVKDTSRIVSLITGGDEYESNTVKKKSISKTEEVLKVENMYCGGILKNITFTLRKGEVLGIGGLAGQGQDELMLALAGYLRTSGGIRLNNKELKISSPASSIRNGIVLIPGDRQKEGLFLNHTIFDNMVYTNYCLKKQPIFIPYGKYSKLCSDIINILLIKAPNHGTMVANLSGGNQQKVVVGKWLSHNPKIMLLADPAKGVDVGAKHELYKFIHKLADENEMSVILYASDNEELIEHCDRVMIMYEGSVVDVLENDEISDGAITAASLRVNREEMNKLEDSRIETIF